jgi:MoaD family protein
MTGIRVRLFASLREDAGASEVEAAGRTVGELVDVLSSRYGDRFARVAAVASFVVNGERAERSTPVAEGDEVAVLPPVSGGAMDDGSREGTDLRTEAASVR